MVHRHSRGVLVGVCAPRNTGAKQALGAWEGRESPGMRGGL
jgi:hypothetical protein